ncbi:MAG: hypothetical protein U5R06_07645 [candidate division KSB1 bacterium]|nr:hypothetical protein [candidate division KSB1 bacterium]
MYNERDVYSPHKKESPFKRIGRSRSFKKPHLTRAYHNSEFLNSNDARVIRMLAEYLETESRLSHFDIKDTVVFYGSARLVSSQEAADNLKTLREKGAEPEETSKSREGVENIPIL